MNANKQRSRNHLKGKHTMHNSFKNLPFFKWYFKNTRNKIVFFVVVFLLGLGYSLLHRPISLIMWDSFRYEKEQIITRELESAMGVDKDKYLQLYDNNIANQQARIRNKILKYIDNLETDLFISTLFGIEELYLQAFLNKSRFFILYYTGFDYAYKLYKNIPYTSQDIQSFNDFLNAFDKAFFFITKLPTREYERYAVQVAVSQTFYITHFINPTILTQAQICSLDTTSLLERLTKAKQIYNTMSPELQKEIGEKGNLSWLEKSVIISEDKLNDCQ